MIKTLKDNVLLQYTVITLILISVFSLILGNLVTKWSVDLQISKHLDLYPQIIKQKLIDYPELAMMLVDGDYQSHQEQMKGIADNLADLGSIFRVKIWNVDDTVVWSNDTSIIGKKFPTNELYKIAILGKNAYEIAVPDQLEQESEATYKEVLEIYIPILFQERVVGAIEIYEATDLLFEEIKGNITVMWIITSASGVIIYIMLFGIFYNAYRKQQTAFEILGKTQDMTIISLAALAETRDNETGEHILRTKSYVMVLISELRNHPAYYPMLRNSVYVENIIKSTPLHDIGKVGVPDYILHKPGKLTAEEFEVMKNHPQYGYDALKEAVENLGSNSFLETARELIYSHHEKWNGSGYPRGLKGDEIPISGRLMALADVYDALVNKRVYKDAFSFEESKNIIMEGSGKHFDPIVVDAFLARVEEFEKIAIAYNIGPRVENKHSLK